MNVYLIAEFNLFRLAFAFPFARTGRRRSCMLGVSDRGRGRYFARSQTGSRWRVYRG